MTAQKATKQITITQTRGLAGESGRTRRAMQALGMGRVGKQRSFNSSPALQGMLTRCAHLIKVTEGGK